MTTRSTTIRRHAAALLATVAVGLPGSAHADDAAPHAVPNGTGFCGKYYSLFAKGCRYFCAKSVDAWPKTLGYAVAGDGAATYAGDIRDAIAFAERLTGTRFAPSAKPQLLVVLTHGIPEKPVRAVAQQFGFDPGKIPYDQSFGLHFALGMATVAYDEDGGRTIAYFSVDKDHDVHRPAKTGHTYTTNHEAVTKSRIQAAVFEALKLFFPARIVPDSIGAS